jgi:signal recognition particle receptor subunit beta
MSSINFATKEISVKVVFYGPGLGGKTTTLQAIWNSIKPERRPQMVSLATDIDRTIFFDFLPVNAYKIGEFVVRLQLYTVPGQVFYNSTRKLVLNGVDGVVFVADSQPGALDDNRESLLNLGDNLQELGMSLGRVPYVIQFNKRDLAGVLSIEALNHELNREEVPHYATTALTGDGVGEVLRGISRLVISDLNTKGVGKRLIKPEGAPAKEAAPPPWPKDASSSIAAAMQYASVPETTASPVFVPPASGVPFAGLSFAGLWPTPTLRARCQEIEQAIGAGDHAAAVLAASQLALEATGSEATGEPALEMLLRGVAPTKFLRFRELVHRARGGESVTQAEALFALHAVNELVC